MKSGRRTLVGAASERKDQVRCKRPRRAGDAESGAGGAAVTVCPRAVAVSGTPLGAAPPTALQREKRLFDLWVLGGAHRGNREDSALPAQAHFSGKPLSPRGCCGLDTFSSRSALLKLWPRSLHPSLPLLLV